MQKVSTVKNATNLIKKIDMREILVPHGVKSEIKDALGYSYPTIREALRGNMNTHASKRIRQAALNKGGIEVRK